MSSKVINLNELIEQKHAILFKKKSIDKKDTEAINEINKEYMRIQKKIQYYSDEEHRKQKNLRDSQNHKINIDCYNEYHKLYYRAKKINLVVCA